MDWQPKLDFGTAQARRGLSPGSGASGNVASGQSKAALLLRELRAAVRSGELPPGARLPAVRDLAHDLGVTPGTVARAYQLAAREGIIDSHVGRGSFVRAPIPAPVLQSMLVPIAGSSGDRVVDLRLVHMPDVGQVAAIRAAAQRAAQRLDERLLHYPGTEDDFSCRRLLAEYLAATGRGGAFDPADMVLTLGGQNALALVVGLLVQPLAGRPAVLTEALSYPGLRHAIGMARAEAVPVAMDGQGILPDALDRAARESGARVLMVTPGAQNPTAAIMGSSRRAEVVEVARRHDLQIVEDDCMFPIHSPGHPPDPSDQSPLRVMAPERVWHVSTLSKSVAPALRVGMLTCPPGLGRIGRLAVQHSYFALPFPLTALIEELALTGDLVRLSVAAAHVQHDRAALAASVFAGTNIGWQPGLPFFWLNLPFGWHASTFVRRAAEEGVLVRSGDEFAASHHAPVSEGVRIALDCAIGRERLAAALSRLRAIHDSPEAELIV